MPSRAEGHRWHRQHPPTKVDVEAGATKGSGGWFRPLATGRRPPRPLGHRLLGLRLARLTGMLCSAGTQAVSTAGPRRAWACLEGDPHESGPSSRCGLLLSAGPGPRFVRPGEGKSERASSFLHALDPSFSVLVHSPLSETIRGHTYFKLRKKNFFFRKVRGRGRLGGSV